MVLDILAVDNFDFMRKIVKKFLVKNSLKCWGFVKIEFLDKNLSSRVVCTMYQYYRNSYFLSDWISGSNSDRDLFSSPLT